MHICQALQIFALQNGKHILSGEIRSVFVRPHEDTAKHIMANICAILPFRAVENPEPYAEAEGHAKKIRV